MGQDTTALLVPGVGHFYLGTPNAAKPADDGDPTTDPDWVEIGFTTYEDPLTIAREGGETTVLPAWQAPGGVRTSTTPISYKLNFNLLQKDATSLALYHGGGSVVSGEFRVPKNAVPQSHQLFVRIIDGEDVHSRYYPKTDIIGADDEELDPEAMAFLPVSATVLDDPDLDYLFAITGPAITS